MKNLIIFIVLFTTSGCGLFAYQNQKLETGRAPRPCHCGTAPLKDPADHASFRLRRDRGRADVLVVLALSGGGSRAAYFSGSVMCRLEKVFRDLDLLKEVDVISAISGGSLPAAYYCISRDRGTGQAAQQAECAHYPEPRTGKVWDEETVKGLMSRNYLWRWVGRWFFPHNIVRYWCTAFDRTDIMAHTLIVNLFGVFPTQRPLRFRELNPERPYLLLNATDGTETVDGGERHFGQVFTFTQEDFEGKLGSDLSRYPLGNAVMASAAFPAVFNYVTLRDFRAYEGKTRYLHLFDGGNSDNLGLGSVQRLLDSPNREYRHIVVILVDAYCEPRGVDRNSYDARGAFSYIMDSNFLDTFDALLTVNRERRLGELDSSLRQRFAERYTFLRIQFSDVDSSIADEYDPRKSLQRTLNRIPTSFQISTKDMSRIDRAVDYLLPRDEDVERQPHNRDYRRTLLHIREILTAAPPAPPSASLPQSRQSTVAQSPATAR